jgi:hypothetical protein
MLIQYQPHAFCVVGYLYNQISPQTCGFENIANKVCNTYMQYSLTICSSSWTNAINLSVHPTVFNQLYKHTLFFLTYYYYYYYYSYYYYFCWLYNPCGFWPTQLSLIILSRKVLQSAIASGTSDPQLRGPMIRTFQLPPQASPSSGRWNYGREMAENLAENGDFHVTFGFFYMP